MSPTRAPTIGATIGPITVAGALGTGDMGVRVGSGTAVPGRGHWSPSPTVVSASAVRVLTTADRYVGTRYRYGGESPGEGFDCSGFVQYVYGRHGVELPRTSYQQSRSGRPAPGVIAALQPGDLMFFATGGRRLGTDRGDWYLRHFVTARRVLSGVQGA